MPRYHVNPSNQVRKCSAASEDTCPYGKVAHFEGSADQAKFMQEALTKNLHKPAPAPKPVQPPADFSFSSGVDPLVAREQADGTYALYLSISGSSILLEDGIAAKANRVAFVRHLGQLARTSGYAGHVFETPVMQADPDVKEIRKVSATDGAVLGFLLNKGGGWTWIRNLNEVKSRPTARPGTGLLSASYMLRVEVAQQAATRKIFLRAEEQHALPGRRG